MESHSCYKLASLIIVLPTYQFSKYFPPVTVLFQPPPPRLLNFRVSNFQPQNVFLSFSSKLNFLNVNYSTSYWKQTRM